MKFAVHVVSVVAILVAFLPAVATPVAALCHDTQGCRNNVPDNNGDCLSWGGVYFPCVPKVSAPSTGAILLLDAGSVQATATATARADAAADSADTFAAGSTVDVTITAHWAGNASHPASLNLVYEFVPGDFVWMSPPGAVPIAANATASDVKAAVNQGARTTYTLQLTDFSGETSATWSFRIRDTHAQGAAHLPISMYVVNGDRATATDGEMTLHVVPQSTGAVPVEPRPFWQDSLFVLLAGLALGLAVGYVVFGRGKKPAGPQGKA